MKKLFWITGLIGAILLSSCSEPSIKDILNADGGMWEWKYNNGYDTQRMKFYEDGHVEILTSGGRVTATGTYEVNEKEKQVILSNATETEIFNEIQRKNGKLSFKHGEETYTMKKIEKEE